MSKKGILLYLLLIITNSSQAQPRINISENTSPIPNPRFYFSYGVEATNQKITNNASVQTQLQTSGGLIQQTVPFSNTSNQVRAGVNLSVGSNILWGDYFFVAVEGGLHFTSNRNTNAEQRLTTEIGGDTFNTFIHFQNQGESVMPQAQIRIGGSPNGITSVYFLAGTRLQHIDNFNTITIQIGDTSSNSATAVVTNNHSRSHWNTNIGAGVQQVLWGDYMLFGEASVQANKNRHSQSISRDIDTGNGLEPLSSTFASRYTQSAVNIGMRKVFDR